MKFRKVKRILALTALAVALCASTAFAADTSTVSVSAEEIAIDYIDGADSGEVSLPDSSLLAQAEEDREGSISVRLTDGKAGTSKGGVRFYCAKIADVTDGEYVLLDAYKDSSVDLNAIRNADDLKAAAERLAEKRKEGTTDQSASGITDGSGGVLFSGLDAGVYLIQAEDTKNYDAVEPSLIAIPTWSDAEGEMLYDVAIEPKHTPKPDIPVNTAPQTGLRDHTLYYLAGAAGCLVVAGILAATGKKKKRNDGR